MSPTAKKGKLAELKVEARALELGMVLSRPVLDARYDYVLDNDGTLERVQVKYAAGTDRRRKTDSIKLSLKKDRLRFDGTICTTKYLPSEVDVLLVYIPKWDKILRFEADEFCNKSGIYINLGKKTKSRQIKGVRFAQDYVW